MLNKETMNVWPILLEKAWAKFNGSYEDIQSNTGLGEGLRLFMPFPLESNYMYFKDTSKSELWDLIKSKFTQN